jgi:hypothetical protein
MRRMTLKPSMIEAKEKNRQAEEERDIKRLKKPVAKLIVPY